NGKRQLQKLFNRLSSGSDLPIHVAASSGAKLTDQWTKDTVAFAKKNDIGLVVIDSFFRVNTADENNAKEVSDAMNRLKQFKDAGIAVILIHHNRKSGLVRFESQEMRGSAVFRDAVDSHITVKRESEDD